MIGRFGRAAFFVLLPAFGVGGALGLPVLLCLTGALSFPPFRVQQTASPLSPPLLLLILFIAVVAASFAWSEFEAAGQASKIAVLGATGILFAGAATSDPRLTRAGGIASFVVLTALLVIEAVWGLPLNRAAQPDTDINELTRNVSRGASLLLALTWGACGALVARPGLFWKLATAAALAGSGFVSLQFGQFANTVAFGAGIGAFLMGLVAPRITILAVISGLLFWLLGAPLMTPVLASFLDNKSLPYSWSARLDIWTYVCQHIWERPWFGHGLDAGRAHLPEIPIHPHSASLQIWFELGVTGVLLAFAALITMGVDLVRRFGDNRPASAAAAGTLTAIGIIANLSFNLWAEWWLATMFVAAGVVGALGRAR